MEGHFHSMPAHMGAYYSNGQPIMPADAYHQPRLQHLQTVSSESLNAHYADMEDPSLSMIPGQGGSRSRRRQGLGAEHIKHRRTRSGCYTCRQRRVKCDEAHPVCERCRKGKRDCVYPEPTSATKPPRSHSKGKSSVADSGSNSSEDEFDPNEQDQLPSIPDEEEPQSATSLSGSGTSQGRSRHSSNTSYKEQSASVSPKEGVPPFSRSSSRPQLPRMNSKPSLKAKGISSSKWACLPKDVRFYMNYHKNHLSHHHYAMKYDTGDFLKTTFLEIALGYEPLLYAITGFSAYHHTLSIPNGKIQNFLGYYNKSVSLLRQSLERSPRHTIATLMTILQLATFEEFLGDWVNLLGHQKAAYEILTELFTPQTIMQSETHRKLITWYIRFDLFAGLMSGYATVLGRDWFSAMYDFYTRQTRDRPNDLGCIFEEKFARTRLLATDVALLFGAKTKGHISDSEFAVQSTDLEEQFEDMRYQLNSTFADTRKTIKSFPNAPEPDPNHFLDSTDPDFLYADGLYTWNFILIDFWAMDMLFKSQMCTARGQPPSTEVIESALRICKMFEALQYAAKDQKAVILGSQASLGIAVLYLPPEERYTMWARQKYAVIEACGYIYPAVLRQRMTGKWNADVSRWWLPNDEGFPPIIQAIREFIGFRARAPKDSVSEDLRDMKGLFTALTLDDSDNQHEGRGAGTDSDQFGDQGSVLYESSPDFSWT